MAETEFEIEHKGEVYLVCLDVDLRWEDDSFNCDKDGGFAVEECGHWEVDWDSSSVSLCTHITAEGGEDIDPESVPGLFDAIVEKADGMEWHND